MLENKKKFTSKKSIFECLENCQKLIEEDQACKIEKFNNVFLIDEDPIYKENSTWGDKWKIGCLRAQLDFFQGLIEFIESLVARKINLLINLDFNWKK